VKPRCNVLSIFAYFSKRDDRKLTMPRVDEGTPNATGIVVHGDILTGRLSVQGAFEREASRLLPTLVPGHRAVAEDYDPVLRFHQRIE
jgi:hypothetical protein